MNPNFQPSRRVAEAVALATTLHADQTRKATGIPYLSHLMGVACLVMEHGGDEDQTIAGLLHDAVEDTGAHAEAQIRAQFGERVTRIVLGCTDGVPNENGEKGDWHTRKQCYLDHLSDAPAEVLLVSGCDKLHNARTIVSDLNTHGPTMFSRFNAGRAGTLWYYDQLASVFQSRLPSPLADELTRTVAEMKRLSSINVRIDDDLKARAYRELEKLGVTPSELMRQALQYVAERGQLPFKPVLMTEDDEALIAMVRERLAAPQRVKVSLHDL